MLAASRRIWSKRAMKHNEKYDVDLAKSFTELHPSVFLGCPGFFPHGWGFVIDFIVIRSAAKSMTGQTPSESLWQRLNGGTSKPSKNWQKKTATISNAMHAMLYRSLHFQHPFCHSVSSPPFVSWVSSLGGSFYGRYLRSSPYEEVAIGSSHRLNVLHNCGALHYDTFKQTESV